MCAALYRSVSGISQTSSTASGHPYSCTLGKFRDCRLTSKTWPCVSGTLLNVNCLMYICTLSYTGQVMFIQGTRKHGHVNLFKLYFLKSGGVIKNKTHLKLLRQKSKEININNYFTGKLLNILRLISRKKVAA